ncbi:MAG: NADPH-dependent F420 reductase [Gammaproteobacteria bacterium]
MSKAISIIGTGKMATGLAQRYAKAGFAVTVGARDLARGRALASGLNIEVASVAAAVQASDTLLLAVPFAAAQEVLAQAGDLTGKVIIDITNPITPDYMALTIGHTTSAAEEIAAWARGATVIKAYNTIFAEMLTHERADGQALQVFYATDDQAAGAAFAAGVRAIGFEPVYSGALSNARYLEPLAELNIHFGYALGWGTLVAPSWRKYA